MLGISYGGISQLFVAATDPPDLAAIAPLSVIDNTATTFAPGGIVNTGFALGWAEDRVHDAEPASPTGGQAWAYQRIQQGDQTCKQNQVLHGEAVNEVAASRANRYYVPKVDNPLAPITFVHKINVPVYLACQFTDEQTGGHCPDLAAHFTGTQRKWFTFTNGVHGDSLDPDTSTRWIDFLNLFVAHQRPQIPALLKAEAPLLYKTLLGVSGVQLPSDPIQAEPSYAAALAAFEKLRSVRILFDNGAGSSVPGNPVPAFEQSFSRFPIPGTRAETWYLQTAGRLGAKPAAGVDRFTWNKQAVPATDFTGSDDGSPGGLWTALPAYNWAENPRGTAVSYLTAKLAHNTSVIGGGGVRLWIKASVPDVDLQVTVTELRPDGKETFVQDGWLRASERKLAPGSTLAYPNPTFSRADVRPLPHGRWAQLSIPLYYEGHVYRRGSRIRIIVSAPNGAQPVWSFAETVPHHSATVSISHTALRPSSLTLPVVPDVHVPTGLPPCPGLRGEPCRTYAPTASS
jgi:predicted acyl esterase